MNRHKATVVAVFAATILAIATTGSLAAEKKEITFAVIATEEMAVVADRWQPTIKYLSKKAGLKINFFASTSYAAAVEALINDFADVAMLGPKIYTVAVKKAPKIVPIVGTGRPPNHFLKEPCACYHGRLITKKGSKFTTIKSLKGAVLALTDPGSTSGNALTITSAKFSTPAAMTGPPRPFSTARRTRPSSRRTPFRAPSTGER